MSSAWLQLKCPRVTGGPGASGGLGCPFSQAAKFPLPQRLTESSPYRGGRHGHFKKFTTKLSWEYLLSSMTQAALSKLLCFKLFVRVV